MAQGKKADSTEKTWQLATLLFAGARGPDAFVKVYPERSAGFSSVGSLQVAASKTCNSEAVKAALATLQADFARSGQWTREDAARHFKRCIAEAPRWSDRNNAAKALNDMAGYNAPTQVQGDISLRFILERQT